MPNIVNKLTVQEFSREVEEMGSCLILGFDKLTVQQAQDLRNRFRESDIKFRVLKNRLAAKVLGDAGFELPKLVGKCGMVFAKEEGAITAAKLAREFATENKAIVLETLAGVVEGELISGADAKLIADMPDKQTVRAQIAIAISGPARSLATVMNAVGGGLARCLQQRADGEGGDSSSEG